MQAKQRWWCVKGISISEQILGEWKKNAFIQISFYVFFFFFSEIDGKKTPHLDDFTVADKTDRLNFVCPF